MSDSWFYRSGDEECGPCSREALLELIAAGALTPDHEVRPEASDRWQPLGEVAGFDAKIEDLNDLSELNFTFEESGTPVSVSASTAVAEPAELTNLDELNFEFESNEAATNRVARMPAPRPVEDDDDETEQGEWFYQSLGQELGPMPVDELLLLARGGALGAEDLVRDGLDGEWVPASTIDELHIEFLAFDENSTPVASPDRQTPPAETPSPSAAETEPEPESETKDEFDDLRDDEDEPVSTGGGASAVPLTSAKATDRWFCRIDDVEHGPLTQAELTSMATHGRLSESNLVRQGDDGDWLPAAEFPSLFLDRPAPATDAAVKAAPSFTDRMAESAKEARKAAKKERGPRKSISEQFQENKTAFLAVLGFFAFAGLVVLAIFFLFGGRSAQSYYDELMAIGEEHKSLRERKAPESEWEPLIARAEALSAEITKDLDKGRASSNQPALQEILFAGRDHLVQMLKTDQKKAGHHEESFFNHLNHAKVFIGNPNATAAELRDADAEKTDGKTGKKKVIIQDGG